jgi:hypothetical protein
MCYSMENVINQYATERRDALCTKDFSGNGTSHNCVVANTANTTFAIDLNVAIQNVLGGRCNSNTDAIQNTWTLFNQSVLKFPENQINNFLRNQVSGEKSRGEAEENRTEQNKSKRRDRRQNERKKEKERCSHSLYIHTPYY